MSLIKKLEKRDYSDGVFTNPLGLAPGAIPTNAQQGYIDGGGQYISTQSALKHWAVWACVRIVADVVSTLPIDLYDKDKAPITPLPQKLIKPSAYASMLQWRWQVLASLLLRGNAYGLYGDFDRLGYPTQVELISPECVHITKDSETGKVLYVVSGTPLTTDQVWHLPGPQLPGQIEGMSPISYAAMTINLGLDAERFGSDTFRNGINPSAVLQSDQQINGAQADEMKDRIRKTVRNREIAVLGAGLKLQPWQVSTADAQVIETQQQNAASVAMIFGVPPEMIGATPSGKSVTYANREQRAQDFLMNAINPWLARLEESLSAWFPRGQYVKFNTGGLLRSDLITRYESYDIGIHSNFLLPSEARALEDLPVIDGIDDKPLPTPSGGSGAKGQGTNGSNQG